MKSLFSSDGIRGVIDHYPLRVEDMERLGRAAAAWLRWRAPIPTLLIGADTRESSQRLKAWLIDGLNRGGVHVVDTGILPTAAISYLVARKGFFAAGAMISASHNPIDENGIKFFDHRGVKLTNADEQAVADLFFGTEPLPFEILPARTRQESAYQGQYARALAEEYRDRNWSGQHVVVDCANGATYQIVPLVLNSLGIHHTLLHAQPDGTNINRRSGSEYVRHHPRWLAAELWQISGATGFALDGDGDRMLLVDREAHLYDGDMVLSMLALKLRRHGALRHDAVVTTRMSNSGLEAYLRRQRIQTRYVGNGDKHVTAALLQEDLVLGGEQIGHVILHTDRDRLTGDGLRTALSVLEELTQHPDLTLPDLMRGMSKWPQIIGSAYVGHGVRVHPEDIPGLAALEQEIRSEVPDLTRLECRPASTEPVYRIMLEARTTGVDSLARQARRLAELIQLYLGCYGRPVSLEDCTAGGLVSSES